MATEVEEFFKGLPNEEKQPQDIFNEKPAPEEGASKESVSEDEPRKNRRHRRLEEALQAERESNIALNERLKVLAETRETERSSNDQQVDERLERVFGKTPEGKEIARSFAEILAEETRRAKDEALMEFEQRDVEVLKEQKMYESVIDEELEALEDEYNIDLTSNAPRAQKARREYLELVHELSPKDEDGMITGYADWHSTFEIYHARQDKPDASRNKELASRSMARSSTSTTKPHITPGWDGWRKDYGFE